jgi:hypothetical protein
MRHRKPGLLLLLALALLEDPSFEGCLRVDSTPSANQSWRTAVNDPQAKGEHPQ